MRFGLAGLLLMALLAGTTVAPPAEANPLSMHVLRQAARWGTQTIASYAAGKVIDRARGMSFKQQLADSLPLLEEELANATGRQRLVLQQKRDVTLEQLEIISALLSSQGEKLSSLEADQKNLLRQIDDLAERVAKIEAMVDGLDDRMVRVEGALLGDCLDREYDPWSESGAFRISTQRNRALLDRSESSKMAVSTWVYLDSCTADFTQRGLLIQLGFTPGDLEEDFALHATLKDVASLAGGGSLADSYIRFEFPIDAPLGATGLEVQEFFLPYSDIPFFDRSGRLALALVVARDGQPQYVLTDRVMSCGGGGRTNCRWVR